jgi:hypothetical protein
MDISFIQIWRVETNQLCAIPWDEHGIFVNGIYQEGLENTKR